MPTMGQGVEEVRLWSEEGTFRVVYIARLPDAVYVLHAFQKKTPATAQTDINLAARRFRALMKDRP
jgi:phage-related protein